MPPKILTCIAFAALAASLPSPDAGAQQKQQPLRLATEKYDARCEVKIEQHESEIHVTWPSSQQQTAEMVVNLSDGAPLLARLEMGSGDRVLPIAENIDPVYFVRVGQRDLNLRGGWTVFFDRMQNKPSAVHPAVLKKSRAVATGQGKRATLTVGEMVAGPFRGELRYTFFAGEPFVLQEAVLTTKQDAVAYLYDCGFVCRGMAPLNYEWRSASGELQVASTQELNQPRHLAVRGRALAAEFEHGELTVFPPPHRYFYPLDFSNNYSNLWIGPNYGGQDWPLGFGIRHDPKGDNRFVPWFNAPPGTAQEMGVFLQLSSESGAAALRDVAKLTRDDTFAPLAGHQVFSSHYHVEHTADLLNSQQPTAPAFGVLPSGGSYRIAPRLEIPGFVKTFRRHGIDIVHLGEFHFGHTPQMKTEERLRHLEHMHAECERLSNENYLLLPGEEPNVHFGGHWISFFPQPVYWVLNRPPGTPFVQEHPRLGRVYHVGSSADVLQLLKAEQGLAWTAHPRIKSSTGFPDNYRRELFFESDRFLGAAFKAMPADLSQPRLGSRVLDLLSDMSNWGQPKYVLGEVDVFKVEPDHELYAHMNVNYLRLDKLPRYRDGWQPILDTLRGGKFFVTTGEILIPNFSVGGKESGEALILPPGGKVSIEIELAWTFPLSYAELISGDGREVYRERIDLTKTTSHSREKFQIQADLAGRKWVRLEVWDIATNGAFTQPVWLLEK